MFEEICGEPLINLNQTWWDRRCSPGTSPGTSASLYNGTRPPPSPEGGRRPTCLQIEMGLLVRKKIKRCNISQQNVEEY